MISGPLHTSRPTVYDAIVVGSGITGGWAAKELTEKGLQVLLVERGRDVRHGADYVTEHKAPWEFRFRDQGDRKVEEGDYKIQSQCYAFAESTQHFFVNDSEHPYLTSEDDPFYWIRGYQLGGRSLTWARQVYRWGPQDFEANSRDGQGVDWPIRYEDLAPWYDYVERFAGVSGRAEGIQSVPDGQFLPPMEMNCAERFVKKEIDRHYSDRTMTIGRTAVLTVPHNGRAPCHYCGPCYRGCSTGSYFSSLSSTLPAAHATGNLTVATDKIVRSVTYDSETRRATGVDVVDALTHETIEYRSRLLFMCASTLGSTQILLNSVSSEFPTGLGNSSGVLGHYLMDHVFNAGATAEIDSFHDSYYHGNRPNGIYIPRYVNLEKQSGEFLRGYAFQGEAWREGWRRGVNTPGFGADFKRSLRDPGKWMMYLEGYGECLPYYENFVELDRDNLDSWGIPLLRIRCSFRSNEDMMRERATIDAAEMLEVAGGRNVETFSNPHKPGFSIHEMGTARMGLDPRSSFLNGFNQSHDVKNLFVTDGSCMTSSACQNPSITYMALTARACSYAVEQLQHGTI